MICPDGQPVSAGAFGSGPFRVTSRWGIPVMGVVEGVAVAADDPPGELPLHAWAAGMRRQDRSGDVEPAPMFIKAAAPA